MGQICKGCGNYKIGTLCACMAQQNVPFQPSKEMMVFTALKKLHKEASHKTTMISDQLDAVFEEIEKLQKLATKLEIEKEQASQQVDTYSKLLDILK